MDTCTGVTWLIKLGGGESTMVIRNFNLRRIIIRKMRNIRLNQYTIIFAKENKNLQCLSSFANGCLRCLYLASSKTQVLPFFSCYTTRIIFRKIFLFFIHPSSTQDTEKILKGHLPPPRTLQFTPMDIPSRGTFLHSVRCISEVSDIQG
jgi:hypothetical protein